MANAVKPRATATVNYARQAEKLSLRGSDHHGEAKDTTAVEARFITPQDPVIQTANGGRLPTVPLKEALELNHLRDEANGHTQGREDPGRRGHEESPNGSSPTDQASQRSEMPEASLSTAIPSSRTNPLFPELPLYGPPSLLRNLQCVAFRCSSAVLSLAFLGVIVLGSAFTSLPLMFKHIGLRLRLKDPNARRPFYTEEKRRAQARQEEARDWEHRKRQSLKAANDSEEHIGYSERFEPLDGGKDPLKCDVRYYARRVGLEMESYKVQTEDGFIIELQHIYNPKKCSRKPEVYRYDAGLSNGAYPNPPNGKRQYPVLLVHGLLQSSGAYCVNDDDSLAFFLAKSGYDVWLGNNRCGFHPKHALLTPNDPRMWNWNIRQMGVMDLPAFVSRVLSETGFEKLGLICHSQGTTEAFVALAKEQRPDLGDRISVFCALAPAVYAGPLIGKMYLKFMRIISPGMFRIFFGIHSFIPFMMTMHSLLPGKLYGALGYRVFAFLFNWTDDRWDQGLRDRFFQFAPVYVSAESMRWWLGRECFATQKCILATREEGKQEDEEDEEEDYHVHSTEHSTERILHAPPPDHDHHDRDRGRNAWYDHHVPPFALWVAGSDELVDGRRLLRRFERRREPHVRVVHAKVIEEYEHLDVLWAIDAVEKVGMEVREVLWKTVPEEVRQRCWTPRGCEEVGVWEG